MKTYGTEEDNSTFTWTLRYTEVRYALRLLYLHKIASDSLITKGLGFQVIPVYCRVSLKAAALQEMEQIHVTATLRVVIKGSRNSVAGIMHCMLLCALTSIMGNA